MTDEQPQPEPQSDDKSADKQHADVGIVVALSREIGYFLDGCDRVRKYSGGNFTFRGGKFGDIRVATVEAGMGAGKATRATQALIDAHTPPWVLSCGYSGALRDGIGVGDIVIANSIVDAHGNSIDVDVNMSTEGTKRLYVGRFVNADEIIRHVAVKKQLAEQYDAIAVDLESLAVGKVCQEAGIPFMAVRVISDDTSADLPAEIVSILNDSGSYRVGATMGAIWKRFGSIKDMWRLREQTNVAAQRLAKFLQGIVVQLYEAKH
jgi:adenosylhomocysteine nucleosidase